ncbi:S41 family peptidase [Deinococcus yavapaiensis]|uniref:Carboxyl-terminal processing protease n=1 Tax=Deinococcus yavapaiensis KR-236 TaxID=694435 RepID=A0A318SQD3_9DEIO|nr:S41 family peptidase [Deinococcus yavapaiensis]PYE54983.1 carboxyl-terminal processing protease [Deinococcus yavapaiensis KR-236]
MRFRAFVVLGSVSLLASGATFASPASDFLSEVTRLLRFYGGPSKVDPVTLSEQARAELDAKCAEAAACSIDTGRAVAQDLVAKFADKHTNLRPPSAAKRARAEMNGTDVARIGVRLVPIGGGASMIGYVRPDSPADRAKLDVGAVVTAINGLDATSTNLAVAEDAGAVTLALGEGRTVTLKPDLLPARDFPTLRVVKGVNVVNIPTFLSEGTASAFFKTLRGLDARTPLVVDVRANGGGNLDECLLAASAFGEVTHDLQSDRRVTRYRAKDGSLAVNGHLVERLGDVSAPNPARVAVLVSERTASCGEIFALSMQKLGATIVGARTAGVMNSAVGLYDLSDGSMLSVTTSKAVGTSGQLMDAFVTPDRDVKLDRDALLQGRDITLEAGVTTVREFADR